MDKQRTEQLVLVAPSKVTLEFELSRIFQCLTLLADSGCARILRVADQAGK